ncbi:MAG: MerR family transcriptional regulator [Planctomycetes bacterium]|nr:MerR family transcriptional regulator [Planctomycetota bacterium]MCP4770906.1 MerR family transcriptional regulator [Planctomycetota bacterium]MCP4862269.1 MerR family transcriptional regulator [Planctomycetota bacterium]
MASAERTFDIATLAQEGGVSSRTIRYYGELGLLAAESRGPGGRRQYGADALERLRFITRLKKLGLSLGEIAELNKTFGSGATPAMLSHLDELLNTRLVEVAERIEDLHALQTDLQSYLDRIRVKSGQPSAPE